MNATEADGALRVLIAERSIRAVVAEYARCLDVFDADGAVAMMTADVIVDYGMSDRGVVRGKEAVRGMIRAGQSRFARSQHLIGQMRIRVGDGTADALSYVLAWHEAHNGLTHTARLHYADQLVRDEGVWHIDRRTVTAMGVDGFAGVDWRWLPRGDAGGLDPVLD